MKQLLSLTLPGGPTIQPPEGIPDGGDLGSILSFAIIILIAIAVSATLIFMIIGAIKWITSGGDAEKVANARRTIIYAIIGFIVTLLAGVIVAFIRRLLTG